MKTTPVVLLLVLGSFAAPGAERGAAEVDSRVEDRLRAGEERVAVLIALRETASLEIAGDPVQRRRAIEQLTEGTLAGVPAQELEVGRLYANAPIVAARVTRQGLEALRRRSEVAAVTLDGLVSAADDTLPQQAAQLGPALMRADLLSTGGLSGFGRSVAVIDSGIDATHPDLGGGPAPNAKVHAGWNVVDGSQDVTDCSGHGTAVAGVIASPFGIAPGAGLVPLRVFSSVDGCQSARFSSVLAAVDWAISHRDDNRIDVLNLSLADNRIRTGFCDAEDPATASVFKAARRAGIAVVAAAGNAGRKGGLSWPACFSDVISVGMVYSAPGGQVSWEDAACRDDDARTDTVPCASNSGSALSLLAPGVRWSTDAPGGGRRSDFSGTSAAAPAAAAALLLLRQTRPYEDPHLAADLLRATGVAVTDAGNGRVSPRIDLASALDATTPVTGSCSATPSGLECAAEVGSMVGNVLRTALALSLDHPDPARLTLALVAPDGTRVELNAGSANELRAIYAPGFEGHAGAGRWRLSVTDPLGAARVVSWALVLTPEPLRGERSLPPEPTAWLPAAVHQAGTWGSFFTTDLRLVNTDRGAPRKVNVGAAGKRFQVTIPPGGTRALDDVLHNAFRTSGVTPLWLSADAAVAVQARTVSTGAMGGGAVVPMPVLAPASALAEGGRAMLQPAWSSAGGRLNVAVLEIAGSEARFQVSVTGADGSMKGTASAVAAPGALTQINDLYWVIDAEPEAGDLLEVVVSEGAGRLLPFATALDNRTNSGMTFTAARAVSRAAVPLPSSAEKAAPIELLLAGDAERPARVALSYAPESGPAFATVVVPVGAGGTRVLSDVLSYFTDAPAGGSLRVTALDGVGVRLAARQVAAQGPGRALPVLDESARGGAIPFLRSSARLGLVETAGAAARARVSLLALDGTLLGTEEVTLRAGGTLEWSGVPTVAGAAERDESTVLVEALDGSLAGWVQ